MKQRGPIWLKTETKSMLNIIKDNNLLKFSLSDSELIQILAKLMKEKGYDRTPLQIRMKLKALEKSYFSCKKKGFDAAVLKQFTHFSILNELYSRKRRRDNEESDGGMISDYNDDNPNIWLAEEIQKMMSIIDEHTLVPDLSNGFTLFALKTISEELMKSGYDKDVEQVETALTSLKMTYKKTQDALQNDINTEVCPYFDSLQNLWGSEIESGCKNTNDNLNLNAEELADQIKFDNNSMITDDKKPDITQKVNGHLNDSINTVTEKNNDSIKWSTEETFALLSVIEETDVFEEFIYNLSTSTTQKLRDAFIRRGYNRTIEELTDKLKHFRDNYLKSVTNGSQNNENCQFNTKIENMIVVKKIDVDKALKTLDVPQKLDLKLNTEHNYIIADKIKLKEEPKWLPMDSVTENEDGFEVFEPEVKIIDEIVREKKVENKKIFNNVHIKPNMTTVPLIKSVRSTSKTETDQKEKIISQPEVYNDQSNEFLKIMATPLPTKLIKIINRDPAIIVERISSSQPPGLVFIPPASSTGSPNINNSSPQLKTSVASSITCPLKITSSPLSIPIIKSRLNSTPGLKNPIKMTGCPPDLSTETLPMTGVIPLNPDVPKSTLELIFKHEEQMQQQHQKWMERQFEIQRKYDRNQRDILLNELRELKKVFTDAVGRSNNLSNLHS